MCTTRTWVQIRSLCVKTWHLNSLKYNRGGCHRWSCQEKHLWLLHWQWEKKKTQIILVHSQDCFMHRVLRDHGAPKHNGARQGKHLFSLFFTITETPDSQHSLPFHIIVNLFLHIKGFDTVQTLVSCINSLLPQPLSAVILIDWVELRPVSPANLKSPTELHLKMKNRRSERHRVCLSDSHRNVSAPCWFSFQELQVWVHESPSVGLTCALLSHCVLWHKRN